MQSEKTIYSFDFMRIITKIPRYLLAEFLNIDELKGECGNFLVRNASEPAFRAGYRSTLCITTPTNRFFELLAFYDLGDYKISYLEVAKDEIRENSTEARRESYRRKKTMMKKYTLNPFTYDTSDNLHKIRLGLETQLFSDQTNYLGSERLRYVVYARLSKLSLEPCIHSEWRILGAYNIKQRMDISSIEDCIDYDLTSFYEEMTEKYIYHAEVNSGRFGKYILGLNCRRKKFSRKQWISIGLAAVTFNAVYQITSTAEFVGFIKKLKKEIKSHRGRKNAFQTRILTIKSDCMFIDTASIE